MSEGIKTFRITESDLTTLEEAIPYILERYIMPDAWGNIQLNERVDMLKKVISNVRWDGMPYGKMERIDVNPGESPLDFMGGGEQA